MIPSVIRIPAARRVAGAFLAASAAALLLGATPTAQVVGRNVNIVGGPAEVVDDPFEIIGDPFLQRQNEPSMACSSRNPLNCLAGANDYRTVDFPGLPDGKVTGDSWLGVFWTRDGGASWRSSLLPGFPQDQSPEAMASPLRGFDAAADPWIRTGAHGMLFYNGIAFNRSAIASNAAGVEGKDGVLFVAAYIDDNNTQRADTPFRYLFTSPVAYSQNSRFIDKPSMAVDIPRADAGTCHIPASEDVPAQSFPAGNIYVVYAQFMPDDENIRSQLRFTRSTDCGKTWSNPSLLSESHKINQSGVISIHPHTGQVLVSWREFNSDQNSDRIVVAQSDDFGRTFKKAVVVAVLRDMEGNSLAFDQPTLPIASDPELKMFRLFRTNSYPTTCIAANGQAYIAWAQRGYGPEGDTRIVYSTSTDGATWSPPTGVDNHAGRGHQLMPAIACAGDQVSLVWYDARDDARGLLESPGAWGPFLEDPNPPPPARTVDVRGAVVKAGDLFNGSVRISRYLFGIYADTGGQTFALQLQHNLLNLPLFAGGQLPFIGDYIDVAPSVPMLPEGVGSGFSGTVGGFTYRNRNREARAAASAAPNGWVFNTSPASAPAFHAIWADNRDVLPPASKDFTQPECPVGNQGGSKNQNVYTARLTPGVSAGALGNARPFGDIQRAFAFYVQNTTDQEKTFSLTIANQPPNGKASFLQFPVEPLDADPLTELTAKIGPFSSVARTIFVTVDADDATSARAPIRIDVDEMPSGLKDFVVLNADPSNPAPADPDLAAFDETHLANLNFPEITEYENPNFLNPNFLNPNFLNPNFLNPNFLNPNFLNPNFLNPNFLNPNFLNPNFLNPNFLNPNFLNPNFLNSTITDMTWTAEAEGNTASAYLFRLLSDADFPDAWAVQLLIYRIYFTPGTGGPDGCETEQQVNHELMVDVLNPNFLNPNFLNTIDFANPNFLNSALDPELSNATFALASGDAAQITLRVVHDGSFDPATVSAVVIPEAIDSLAAHAGETTPSFTLTITTDSLAGGIAGMPYSQQLGAAGGTPPYTWTVAGGGLPPGLTLSPDGEISGVPTTPGTFGFTVLVVDSHPESPQQAAAVLSIGIVDPSIFVTDLDFPVGPTDAAAGATMLPAVQVRATDVSGTVVPGATVTLALGSNPGGAILSGTLNRQTDALGVATFDDLSLSQDGEGYTLVATAGSSASATSRTFNVGSISFEMYPDGSPACASCALTDEFASRGVVFSFAPTIPELPEYVDLADTAFLDPAGGPTNHSVTNPRVPPPGSGWAGGVLVMTFGALPSDVSFRVRKPTNVTVRAFDEAGAPIPSSQVSIVQSPYITAGGQERIEAQVSVTHASGVSYVEVDAEALVAVDNLKIALDSLLLDFPLGASGGDQIFRGFYHPSYPASTLTRVELWFSSDTAGARTLSLTARQGDYSGPIVGASTATVDIAGSGFTPATFFFPASAVSPGSVLTFAIGDLSGLSGLVFYAVPSAGDPSNPIVQTEDTTPPLSTFRRQGVNVRIYGAPAP